MSVYFTVHYIMSRVGCIREHIQHTQLPSIQRQSSSLFFVKFTVRYGIQRVVFDDKDTYLHTTLPFRKEGNSSLASV